MSLTTKQRESLTQAVKTAYRELCEHNECACITQEEHERSLGRKEFDFTFPNPYGEDPFDL